MSSSSQTYSDHWKTHFQLLMDQLSQLDKNSAPQLACTPKELIYSENKLKLFCYKALDVPQKTIPILITYALVNRPDIVDLEPDRSLVLRLLEQGFTVYLIDWGYPDSSDCFTSLDDYINGLLHRCIQQTKRHSSKPTINLLGICQGGVFSLCYAALYPENINQLVTVVSPIDFHSTHNTLGLWVKNMTMHTLSKPGTNVPGELISVLFKSLKPFQLTHDKYRQPANLTAKKESFDTFLRMEHWLNDNPDLAAQAANEFMQSFYQQNSLHKKTLRLANEHVLLSNIRCPVLNFYATKDHIVPPSSAQALSQHIDQSLYHETPLQGGHIGAFTSQKTQQQLINKLTSWLE